MQAYEKLGAFYLGRPIESASGKTKPEYLLYDAKDLTTHAVCVGMTGSGKTGLCLALLEEAAIDGIPVLAIDPKGDLGNLLLTFPQLRPEDFAPWVDAGEAMRKGMEPSAYAASVAETWRKGLAEWDQDGERIARLRAAAEFAIYTPGSTAGIPLTVLRSFAAPPAALANDPEALAERVTAAVSGLLAMLGRDADPVQSKEHILLSNIVSRAWQEGRDLALGDLIRQVHTPPFAQVGFFDVESFFPAAERQAFAMALNNLLASPSFAGWTQGESLDVARLLWTPQGKPRVSIVSIAHLPDAQRMFFVTLLLNEVVAWMRTQPGTTSLRALLYMDEVFGYFPPVANPPAKLPMLTLLKQARAYGLGCVLATQNPVDLDYKGLANAGTWFLGRLQTERDKARVLEGLEGASAAAGAAFDRAAIEATLASLPNRSFLMNNVHEDTPVLFQTRWAMSYLRGPLTRDQIKTLMAGRASTAATAATGAVAATAPVPGAAVAERPVVPPDVEQAVLPITGALGNQDRVVYRPALLGLARLHYTSSRDSVDEWRTVATLAALDGDADAPWERAQVMAAAPGLERDTDPRGSFAEVPAPALRGVSYKSWNKQLRDYLYRAAPLELLSCAALGEAAKPGESERDFRARLAQKAREARDLEVEKLRARYAPKLAALQSRLRSAEGRVEREQAQFKQQTLSTAVSFGTTLLGALFGRKVTSAGNVGRAASAVRSAGRAAQERGEVARAQEQAGDVQRQIQDMETDLAAETARLQAVASPETLELQTKAIAPTKSDIDVTRLLLVWTPWRVGAGNPEPLFH